MSVINFCDAIQNYSDSLVRKLKIENKSKNTILTYKRTYNSFIEFCKQYDKTLSLENIKEDDIYAFIDYKNMTMNKQGEISNATVNAIIIHLKRLFTHIERNSDALYDFDKVFQDMKLKKIHNVPKGLGDSDVSKLVDYLELLKDDETFLNYRNIILIKFLLHGGLRASEAVSISLNNITLDEPTNLYKLVFKGKGEKNRITYIKHKEIHHELEVLRDILAIEPNQPIAKTSTGNFMDRIQLSKMVNSVYNKAGIKATGIHILRHTAAKRLLKAGVSIVAVQSILGHSSIQTTSIYANPTESIVMKELISC